jgi:hypothetical protein
MARDAVLRVTGHAYWHAALAAAAVAGVWFVVAHVRHHFAVGRRLRPRATNQGSVPLFAELAVIQVAVFAGMEVIERITAGAPMHSLLDRHLLIVGLGSQLVVAAGLALVSWALGRAAAAAGQFFAGVALIAPRTARVVIPTRPWWPRSLAVVPCGTRGPPLSL